MQQAARQAEIDKKVTPHFLRHSHGTHAAMNKAPAAVIQETFGHESLETTMQISSITGPIDWAARPADHFGQW